MLFIQIEQMLSALFLLEKQHPTKEKTMKKGTVNQHDPDLLDEYDFSQGVRGKYAQRYREGTNIVRLDDDVAQIFPDAKSVNPILRSCGCGFQEFMVSFS